MFKPGDRVYYYYGGSNGDAKRFGTVISYDEAIRRGCTSPNLPETVWAVWEAENGVTRVGYIFKEVVHRSTLHRNLPEWF